MVDIDYQECISTRLAMNKQLCDDIKYVKSNYIAKSVLEILDNQFINGVLERSFLENTVKFFHTAAVIDTLHNKDMIEFYDEGSDSERIIRITHYGRKVIDMIKTYDPARAFTFMECVSHVMNSEVEKYILDRVYRADGLSKQFYSDMNLWLNSLVSMGLIVEITNSWYKITPYGNTIAVYIFDRKEI